MAETVERSTHFRLTVVTGVSDVSGCSANQRKRLTHSGLAGFPTPSTLHPSSDALLRLVAILSTVSPGITSCRLAMAQV
jgi:hypothetical protein